MSERMRETDAAQLREELDRVIGGGPALPVPEARLAAGRRALRRRRTAVGIASAGAVVAVVAPLAALAGGTASTGVEPVPAAPASTASPSPSPTESSPAEEAPAPYVFSDRTVPAEVDFAEGVARVRPGAVVHERRRDVFPGKDTESLALDLTWRGERWWVLLEWDEGGGGGTYTGPQDQFADSFDAFVAQQVAGGGSTSGPARPPQGAGDDDPVMGEVVGLAWQDGALVASGDTEVLEQRSGVDLGPSFAAESETTGAALVQMAGERQLVLYRQTEGEEGQLIAVLASGNGEDLDALLAWARERYESGEGLL